MYHYAKKPSVDNSSSFPTLIHSRTHFHTIQTTLSKVLAMLGRHVICSSLLDRLAKSSRFMRTVELAVEEF